MPIQKHTCYVAVCDLCGATETGAGSEPHMPTEQSALDWALNLPGGDPAYNWTLTPDGRLVCRDMEDAAHREVHEAAGKTITGCAMTMVFD